MKIKSLVVITLFSLIALQTKAEQVVDRKKIDSDREWKYFQKILVSNQLLSAISYAENFVSDCRSKIELTASIVHLDGTIGPDHVPTPALELEYVCTDNPSHDATVTIFLDEHENLDKFASSKVEFEIE